MRVMATVRSDRDIEAGAMPTAEELTQMGRYNEELVEAGVLLAGEGLQPSAKGVRVRFDGDERTVTHGPFGDPRELTAGFWILQVPSLEDAIEWIRRCPMRDAEIELRQISEAEDFGEEFAPEARQAEERLRARIAEQQ